MTPNTWLCCAAIILLLSTVCEPAYGKDEEESRPHQIYMQRLHSKYDRKSKPYLESNEKSEGGILLATSIEADKASVIPDGGFPIKNGSSVRLFFTVPKQQDANNIQSAELWLFPNVESVRAGHTVDIIMSITATFPHARTPRREAIELTWRPEQGCMRLDLTKRNLGLNETNVTVLLETLSVIEYRADPDLPRESSTYRELLDVCKSLQARTSDSPFLVVKFFASNEELDSEDISEVSGNSLSETEASELAPPEKRRAMNNWRHEDNGSASGSGDDESSTSGKPTAYDCTLTDLEINFAQLGIPNILVPTNFNIKQCSGRCSVRYTKNTTNHAKLKHKYAILFGIEETSVTCVPVAYRPAYLVVKTYGGVSLISFPNFVAAECGCR